MLDIELITGRTHQIRAHLSYIGNPIIGDTKYGNQTFNNKYKLKHQELISYKLIFNIKESIGYLDNLTVEIKNIKFNIQQKNDF